MSETATARRVRRSHTGARTLGELAVRISECENDIHDIKADLRTAMGEFGKLKDRLNIWGALIIGAMAAGGLISDQAAAILKAVVGNAG